jgi:VWFA-related protein
MLTHKRAQKAQKLFLKTICAFLWLILGPFCGSAYSQQLTAREILDRVSSTYASCRSYSDEGEVKSSRKIFSRTAHFTTVFVRPGGFKYELESETPHGRFVIWKDAETDKSWTALPPNERELPLEEGLSRIAFFSGGSSLVVPSLLLSKSFISMGLLELLEDPKLTGTEKIDGKQTYRVEGKHRDQVVKLWIDQSNFLILKTYRGLQATIIGEEVTIKYKPVINVDINAGKVAFKPPEVKGLAAPKGTVTPQPSRPEATNTSAPPNLKRFGQSLGMNAVEVEQLRRKKQSRSDDEDVVRVDTDLVVSEILVLDHAGKFITGLTAKDFMVKEDDRTQAISSFSLGDAGLQRSIVLILDYSGSQLPYIKTSVQAAKMLVDKLNPTDRMAIVSDDVKLLVDFTSDKALLKTKLDALRTSALAGKVGRSDQYDALLATLRELFSEEDVRPIVIFQTDGDQLEELKGQETFRNRDPYALTRKYGLPELKTESEKARATIFSIIPGVRFIGFSEDELVKRAELDLQTRREAWAEVDRLNNRTPAPAPSRTPSKEALQTYSSQWLRRHLTLADVAMSTGGWVDHLEQPEQANIIYSRVLANMNSRYVIGYYPTNKARDGKRRMVTIEVRDHPEYIVWGRKAYFAPLD